MVDEASVLLCLGLTISAGLCQVPTAQQCVNKDPDDFCQTQLAEADKCTLKESLRCFCLKSCNVTKICNGADRDLRCNCPFVLNRCGETFMDTDCPTSCQIYSSIQCPHPKVAVPNASLLYNGSTASGPARYMVEATMTCNPGYDAINASSQPMRRVCDAKGSWVVDPDQQNLHCQKKTCGEPPAVAKAMPSSPSGYYGDRVTYSCLLGQDKVGGGSATQMCNASGQWQSDKLDPAPPLCVGSMVRFLNSKRQEQAPPPDSITSLRLRSGLECASRCARDGRCHGYTFRGGQKQCDMNTGAAGLVTTGMLKVGG